MLRVANGMLGGREMQVNDRCRLTCISVNLLRCARHQNMSRKCARVACNTQSNTHHGRRRGRWGAKKGGGKSAKTPAGWRGSCGTPEIKD